MKVPYFDLQAQYLAIRDEILSAMDRVCRSASFILGQEVEEFEKEFAAYCHTTHCVALNSGTSALHLALLAAGVEPHHEVITTANTFVATVEAICYVGARPVFVDIDPTTANIDPQLIEAAVTVRTKAILPVHLYGRPADLEPILTLAKRHNLVVIEDACQAHGASYRGARVGSLGQSAAFSFYPGKNLGAYGEGGALVTNDDRVALLARSLRSHGGIDRYRHEHIGYNYRMDGLQGAVLRIKLKHLDEWTERRRHIARLYRKILSAARLHIPQDDPLAESVYHLFVVYVEERDAVRAALQARGVETGIHYPRPVHLHRAYDWLGYKPGSFPHAERACDRGLSLPLFPEMTDEQVEYAAHTLVEQVGIVDQPVKAAHTSGR